MKTDSGEDTQKEPLRSNLLKLEKIALQKELASLREQLVQKEKQLAVADEAHTLTMRELQQKEDENRELVDAVKSVIRLKPLIAYSDPVEVEHLNEAMAISLMFDKLDKVINLSA